MLKVVNRIRQGANCSTATIPRQNQVAVHKKSFMALQRSNRTKHKS